MKPSRAAVLLRRLIETGAFSPDDVARELLISRPDIDAFVGNTTAMPLSSQLSLADLVIARSPKFVRSGYALRGQVLAAKAFRGHDTATHGEPPTSWASGSRRRT